MPGAFLRIHKHKTKVSQTETYPKHFLNNRVKNDQNAIINLKGRNV